MQRAKAHIRSSTTFKIKSNEKEKRFLSVTSIGDELEVALVVSSCSDDDDLYNSEPAASARSFDYGLWMYGENAYRQLVLDNLSTEIKTVNVNSPWLKASVGEMVGGHPTLILESRNAKGSDLPNAVLTVTTENGEEAHITVKHSEMTLGDAYSSNNNGLLCNEQNNFLTEWWKCNTVKINGLDMPQATPWTRGGWSLHSPNRTRLVSSRPRLGNGFLVSERLYARWHTLLRSLQQIYWRTACIHLSAQPQGRGQRTVVHGENGRGQQPEHVPSLPSV